MIFHECWQFNHFVDYFKHAPNLMVSRLIFFFLLGRGSLSPLFSRASPSVRALLSISQPICKFGSSFTLNFRLGILVCPPPKTKFPDLPVSPTKLKCLWLHNETKNTKSICSVFELQICPREWNTHRGNTQEYPIEKGLCWPWYNDKRTQTEER